MNIKYMKIALKEAKKAYLQNEVPVGAVIVKNGVIIAKAHNQKVRTKKILNHAELIALTKAGKKIGDWRLNGCDMYITLEPCPMCAGAIQQSRINKVYIGTKSNISSNGEIIKNIFNNSDNYHTVEIEYINDIDCSKILSEFFLNKR